MRPPPDAEIHLDESLVRRLLATQHPDLADRRISLAAQGWDNAIFRCGDDLAVRLPRRASAVALLRHEQEWLPVIGPGLELAVPTPVRSGLPGAGYPWPWSVVPWIPGTRLADRPATPTEPLARDLTAFANRLHRAAPPEAPSNPARSLPLHRYDRRFRERVNALRSPRSHWAGTRLEGGAVGPTGGYPLGFGPAEAAALTELWESLVHTPEWQGPALWVHGDLHPLNLLVSGERLAAVLDFGDLFGGDPAVDLMVAWTLLDRPARRTYFAESLLDGQPVDSDTWQRARGWALYMGVTYRLFSANATEFDRVGRHTLSQLIDPESVSASSPFAKPRS